MKYYYYGVVFEGNDKIYKFRSSVELEINGIYKITNELNFNYNNTPIQVKYETEETPHLRTIIRAEPVMLPSRKRLSDNLTIKAVYFNEKKRTTTVRWADGKTTTVHCAPEDTFDKSTGIAMCFMKKAHGNRGHFNELLKKWSKNGIDSSKKEEKDD